MSTRTEVKAFVLSVAEEIHVGYDLEMSSAHQFQSISVRDYLVGENHANRKHEYVEGLVYSMAGASNSHNRIATNATGLLYSQLRGQKCQVFNSDTKVRIRFSSGTRFYYPDVSVVCRPNPPVDTFHDAPIVIVEVISESTRRTDEYEKREAYLTIDSLSVYILVEQNSARVLAYRRTDSGFLAETYSELEAVIPLPEIDCAISLIELFANIEFPTAEELREQAMEYEV